jgi:thiamine-monophosphate kinase
MAERSRIATYFAPLTRGEPGSLNLTDDAALLTPPFGTTLVVTTDSVIEGIHVLPGATPQQFAQKLVRRNLSDLAAMGATPWRYFLNLHTTSAVDDAWVAAFAAALEAEQTHFSMVLAGGDSTSGGEHIHTTLTCLGLLEVAALTRNGAQIGDDVYVGGTLGDAALGLAMLQGKLPPHDAAIAAYHRPEPQLALGQKLRGIATACMDISDGLLADAQAIAAASNVQIALDSEALPLSEAARGVPDDARWNAVLSGGDDYVLLFTAPSSARAMLTELATRIGAVVPGEGVLLDGATVVEPGGYEHR